MKRTALAEGKSSSSSPSSTRKGSQTLQSDFALCLDNKGYEASLEVGKVYQIVPDEQAATHGYLRIVDESGEDYAFAATRFHRVELPPDVQEALLAKS